MRCSIHGIEMEWMDEVHGQDIWYCDECHTEEEAEFQRTSEDYEPELDWDGDECSHCQSTYTQRIDTICNDPVIWACQCANCGETFEVLIPPTVED